MHSSEAVRKNYVIYINKGDYVSWSKLVSVYSRLRSICISRLHFIIELSTTASPHSLTQASPSVPHETSPDPESAAHVPDHQTPPTPLSE